VPARHHYGLPPEVHLDSVADLLRYRKKLDPIKDGIERALINRRLYDLRNALPAKARAGSMDAAEIDRLRLPGERTRHAEISSALETLKDDRHKERRLRLETRLYQLDSLAIRRHGFRDNTMASLQHQLETPLDTEDLIYLKDGSIKTRKERDKHKGLARRCRELNDELREADAEERPCLLEERQRTIREGQALDRLAYARGLARKEKQEVTSEGGLTMSVSERLALLKQTLVESPETVADSTDIQKELRQLEDTLRASLVAGTTPNKYTADIKQKSILITGKEHVNTQRSESTATGVQVHLPAPTPSPQEGSASKSATRQVADAAIIGIPKTQQPTVSQTHIDQDLIQVADTETQGQSQSALGPEDLAVLVDLKSQIQELTNMLKLLIPQQIAEGSATEPLSAILEKTNALVSDSVKRVANMSNSGSKASAYTAKPKSPVQEAQDLAFAMLPHEIGFEDGRVSSPGQSGKEITSDAARADAEAMSSSDLLHDTSQRIDAIEAATNTAATIEQLGSLYEQLFPEEATQFPQPPTSPESVPRLSLVHELHSATLPVSRASFKPENLAPLNNEQQRTKSVLILRHASKTLTEDDFRRALPKGKHLQEWTQKGEYENIIPVRDFWTLERTGDYYIVFKHDRAADAFLAHVKRVFELTKQHIPTRSLLSDLPPAPKGLLSDGVDNEAELVRNFSLLAPSMFLSLERETSGIKSEVLKKGGYPQAFSSGLTPETPQVLLELDGGVMPNWFQLRDAITKDGQRRNLPWNLIPGELGIRRLEMQRPTRAQRDLESQGEYGSIEAGTHSEFAARDGDTSVDVDDAHNRLNNGQNGQRWVVAFREREEAQRFARGWHMRGFPWTEEEKKRDRFYRGVTRVKAEMLW
jgi:hypothetical protein